MKALLLTAVLLAHDWYPMECCHDKDCFPVDCAKIHSSGGNWEFDSLFIDKSKSQVSPDGSCHICVIPHISILCIFLGGEV